MGLPNETIRIRQGDLYLWDPDQDPAAQILRKDNPDKQRALQIPVYDDNYSPTGALAETWPERWAGMQDSGMGRGLAGWVDDPGAWQLDAGEGRRVYRPDNMGGVSA